MHTPLRIAVADDERDVREYLQEALTKLGHQVVAVADSGRSLVEQCQTTLPDVVITDVKMAELDGFDAADGVNRLRPTPIIVVSAHHEDVMLQRAAASQVMAYLTKPVKMADLGAAIGVAVRRFEHFRALTLEADSLRQALEDRKLVERAKGIVMKRLRVSEDEAFRRVRKLANDQNRKLVDVARTVASADQVFEDLEKR